MALCSYSLIQPTAWLDLYQATWQSEAWLETQNIFEIPLTGESGGHISSFTLVPSAAALVAGAYFLTPSWSLWLTSPLITMPNLLYSASIFVFIPILHALIHFSIVQTFKITHIYNFFLAKMTVPTRWTSCLALEFFYPDLPKRLQQAFYTSAPRAKEKLLVECFLQMRLWIWHIASLLLTFFTTYTLPSSIYCIALGLFFSGMNLFAYPIIQKNFIMTKRSQNKKKWLLLLILHSGFHAISSIASWWAAILMHPSPALTLPPIIHSLAQCWLFANAWVHFLACIAMPVAYFKRMDLETLYTLTQTSSSEGYHLKNVREKYPSFVKF